MKYFVLLLLLFPSPVTAQCKEAISTKDMQDGMDNEWKKSDADLNRVYQESLKKLKPEQAALFKNAQRAWLTYRDAQCEADYKMFAAGTAAPPSPHSVPHHPDSRAHQDPEGHLPESLAQHVSAR